MKEITDLEPKALWQQFAKVCSIPHPSKHEEKIRQYVIDFAETHGLEYQQDTVGNIVVRKAAAKDTKGIRRLFCRRIWTWYRRRTAT